MTQLKAKLLIFILMMGTVVAWGHRPRHFVANSNTKAVKNNFRANCIEARSETDLDINNVRARLRTGGDLWWDGTQARYIVPNVDPASGQPEISALFAGGIWLGAVDEGGNLILAAQTYRNGGNDYWAGPLNVAGNIEKADCEKWDRFFTVYGHEIDALRSDFFEPGNGGINSRPATNIMAWPGRGNPYFAEYYGFELPDQELAPFIEPPGMEDGIYDPMQGDHPVIEVNGCGADYFNPVYADQMEWWVYNDKGNSHTNSNGEPMSMEIQALAFGYQTTDAINNMTFYRYKLLNKNNSALENTYFSLWSDPDLGCSRDDYIGADTTTGMGYVYNADQDDEDCGSPGYGSEQIPALAVDYFRGPLDSTGNEIGLSSFMYYENSSDPVRGDPVAANEYYRLMQAIWKNGDPLTFGGTGYGGSVQTNYAYLSFPNRTGTGEWSMCTEAIQGADYRFLHTSGPFVLKPGAVNELISGVVWVPEIPDYPCPSLKPLIEADVLAQNLFDDCFKITDGPDAPYIDIIEMENELILNLSYTPNQNNYELTYEESPSKLSGFEDSTYRFQGYKIYQVINENISVTELEDPEKARLVFQVDLKDSVDKIVNWTTFDDPDIQAVVPNIMVDGQNQGVQHTFKVTKDEFAQKNPKLVNHKDYYYCVVAYGFNEYLGYNPALNTGQATPYLQGRRNFRIYTGIPRPNDPGYNGIVLNANYGDRPEITRIDGQGNGGGLFLDLKEEEMVETTILNNGKAEIVTYAAGNGPVDIKIVDPLRVPPGKFQLYISDEQFEWVEQQSNQGTVYVPQPPAGATQLGDSLYWRLISVEDPYQSWTSYLPLEVNYEHYIPELGISLLVNKVPLPGQQGQAGFIGASKEYRSAGSEDWLLGLADGAGIYDYLRTSNAQPDQELDPEQDYSTAVNGWHPLPLASVEYVPGDIYLTTAQMGYGTYSYADDWRPNNKEELLNNVNNVNVVITPDKSKWSRCIVTETASRHHSDNLNLSIPSGEIMMGWKDQQASRDKQGNIETGSTGMSWFPGYAYDVETGERLNIFFGENSFYNGGFFDAQLFPKATNGNDMLFNPTDQFLVNSPLTGNRSQFLASALGGQHVIYVTNQSYDECQSLIDKYNLGIQEGQRVLIDRDISWATFAYLSEGMSMHGNNGTPELKGHVPPSELVFKLRVERPYEHYRASDQNEGFPLYEFDLGPYAPTKEEVTVAEEALAMINVVPNPYYAYSAYEATESEQIIKITNLPAKCKVSIYTLDGRLVRNYNIAQEYNTVIPNGIARLGAFGSGEIEEQILTSINWDLKNSAGVPVSSGVYLIHVQVPGVGERVVKSFLIGRQLDAQKL